jgi:hypothetical protein
MQDSLLKLNFKAKEAFSKYFRQSLNKLRKFELLEEIKGQSYIFLYFCRALKNYVGTVNPKYL